jgi:ribosome biogenesis protein SSF1/2
MTKRRTKNRTHIKAARASNGPGKSAGANKTPKSMVIRMGAGEVGPSVSQLAKDLRAMMEPDTASRLKVWHLDISARMFGTILTETILRREKQID